MLNQQHPIVFQNRSILKELESFCKSDRFELRKIREILSDPFKCKEMSEDRYKKLRNYESRIEARCILMENVLTAMDNPEYWNLQNALHYSYDLFAKGKREGFRFKPEEGIYFLD